MASLQAERSKLEAEIRAELEEKFGLRYTHKTSRRKYFFVKNICSKTTFPALSKLKNFFPTVSTVFGFYVYK